MPAFFDIVLDFFSSRHSVCATCVRDDGDRLWLFFFFSHVIFCIIDFVCSIYLNTCTTLLIPCFILLPRAFHYVEWMFEMCFSKWYNWYDDEDVLFVGQGEFWQEAYACYASLIILPSHPTLTQNTPNFINCLCWNIETFVHVCIDVMCCLCFLVSLEQASVFSSCCFSFVLLQKMAVKNLNWFSFGMCVLWILLLKGGCFSLCVLSFHNILMLVYRAVCCSSKEQMRVSACHFVSIMARSCSI